ncbi:MAG TPA: fasciclin domain-containing protein, partial [Candidatus Saccharimonadales bacterium]|nr:fasciclin domain-containing protein [Candidatus Saccharimonadales bacterium]
MKKLLLALGLTVSVLTLSAGSASAHSYDESSAEWNANSESSDWDMGYDADTCGRISARMAKINAKFDQDNDRRVERQQRLIDRANEEGCPAAGSITDELVANGNFTTLVTAVQAAGLADTLSAPGELTVFAPTDQAFAELPAGTVDALVKDIPALTNILTQHVVAGTVDSETALEAGKATALNGNTLTITEDGCELTVN